MEAHSRILIPLFQPRGLAQPLLEAEAAKNLLSILSLVDELLGTLKPRTFCNNNSFLLILSSRDSFQLKMKITLRCLWQPTLTRTSKDFRERFPKEQNIHSFALLNTTGMYKNFVFYSLMGHLTTRCFAVLSSQKKRALLRFTRRS